MSFRSIFSRHVKLKIYVVDWLKWHYASVTATYFRRLLHIMTEGKYSVILLNSKHTNCKNMKRLPHSLIY